MRESKVITVVTELIEYILSVYLYFVNSESI